MASEVWPRAFRGVPLDRHLSLVALVSTTLFQRDLEVLERRMGEENLEDVLLLASALHDIGKASNYYKSVNSFVSHELVSAHLILEARSAIIKAERDNRDVDRVLRLVAGIVSRHHASMEYRHPADLVEDPFKDETRKRKVRKRLEEAAKAIKHLDSEGVAGTLDSVASSIYGGTFSRDLLRKVAKEIKQFEWARVDEEDLSIILQGKTIESLTSFKSKDLVLVKVLSGMLIVGDILTASFCEDREPASTPTAYAQYWRSELWGRLEEARGVLEKECSRLYLMTSPVTL